jgi:co-chaperonin GroES (HSP10)
MEELSKLSTDSTTVDTPDPDLTGFNITGHKLLLRPLHVEGKTKGGLLLAQKTQHDLSYLMNVCKVLAVGPRAYKQEMFNDTGPWCDVGDYVLIPRLGGQKIKLKGVPLTMISCDQVMAVIDDPADVDPNFNISTGGKL